MHTHNLKFYHSPDNRLGDPICYQRPICCPPFCQSDFRFVVADGLVWFIVAKIGTNLLITPAICRATNEFPLANSYPYMPWGIIPLVNNAVSACPSFESFGTRLTTENFSCLSSRFPHARNVLVFILLHGR